MKQLCFPEKVLDQHMVFLGKTGAGKSSAMRHVAEHLLGKGKRVCIVDPKGDWWGLKLSADGKSPGFPLIAFGNFKDEAASDVAINDRSGKPVAELVATGNRPSIIGFRGWMPAAMVRFWVEFTSTLFNANSGELFLLIDECHNFAPKGRVMDPEVGKSLHWTNRILSEGRGLGLVCIIASQRPQKVHNDTLTSCETLAAMRVIHAADRDAVKDWIDGCGEPATGKEMLKEVANMKRGEAFLWSPEIQFGPERVKFPLFETFDSFAPPQLQKKVGERDWSKTDLEAVKAKLASAIEEAKANDPKELRARIAQLERELKHTPAAAAPERVVEIPVLTENDRALISRAVGSMDDFDSQVQTHYIELKNLRDEVRGMMGAIESRMKYLPGGRQHVARSVAASETSTPRTRVAVADSDNNELPPMGKGERVILVAIVQHEGDGCTREQLTVLTGYKRSSRDTYLQRLFARGYVETIGAAIVSTGRGVRELGTDYERLPRGSSLRSYWLDRLSGGEKVVLEYAVRAHPQALRRDEITEYKRSSRDTFIQRLLARKLITAPAAGMIRASDTLF